MQPSLGSGPCVVPLAHHPALGPYSSDPMADDAPDTSLLGHKRRRSPGPSPSPLPHGNGSNREGVETVERLPKRLRRSHEIPAYDASVQASGLSGANPLNRRMLKRAAKKARRAARPRTVVPGMEVDDEGLDGTFLAGDGGLAMHQA